MRKIISLSVATALISSATTPAFARWHGYDNYHHHKNHHDDDHVSAGDVIGVIAVVGIIAAIVAASKAKRRARELSENGNYDQSNLLQAAVTSEDAAVDACATAAEERSGKTSSVRDITKVSASENGWNVEGTVERRDDWRNTRSDLRNFTCVVRGGGVKDVLIDINAIAAR